jgi:hypothetical protein
VAVRGTSAVMPDADRPSATNSSATARFVAAEAEPAWDLSDFAVARSDLHRVDVVGGCAARSGWGAGDQLVQRALVEEATGADDRDAVA